MINKYLFHLSDLRSVIVENSKNVVCRKQSKVTLPTKQINSELNSDNKTGKTLLDYWGNAAIIACAVIIVIIFELIMYF